MIELKKCLILSEGNKTFQEELQLASSTKDVRGHVYIESNLGSASSPVANHSPIIDIGRHRHQAKQGTITGE